MPPGERDRRAHPRWPYVNTVQLQHGGSWHECQAANVSYGGIFVSIEAPPPEGTRVAIRLQLKERAQPLELSGLVVRCVADRGAGIGCGVPACGRPHAVAAAAG